SVLPRVKLATSDTAEPTMPPIPTTDAVAFLGNKSEAKVKRFADHAWCPAAPNAIKATATHWLSLTVANATGIMESAHTSSVIFRALLSGHPRFMNAPDSQPPRMLPTSAPT